MKRLVLFVSIIILGVCSYFLYDSSMEFKKYSNLDKLKKNITKIDKEISDFETKIESKESEINSIREEKSEDVRLLEVWKKEAQKVS